jgi:hypothetical protein
MTLLCSQEVWYQGLVRDGTSGLVSQSVEDIKGFLKLVVDIQNGSNVTASVAVIRSGPNGNQILVSKPVFETIHYKLMCSGNQIYVINVIVFACHFRSEQPSCSSWGHSPCFNIFWIGPHQIAEWTLMRNLHSSVNKSNLVNSLDFW